MARAFEAFEAFGGFEASQTAALNAQKKPLLRPRGALEPLLWLCGLGYLFPAELGKLLEEVEGLEGLRPRKRQP